MEKGLVRFDRALTGTALTGGGLAIMMVGMVSRQAASPTSRVQARLARPMAHDNWLHPISGAFHAAAAQMLTHQKE